MRNILEVDNTSFFCYNILGDDMNNFIIKCLDSYYKYLLNERNFSLYTIISYKEYTLEYLNYFQFNNYKEICITRDDVRLYLKYLDKLNISNATISKRLSVLRNFYNYLIINGYTDNNPFKSLKNPKISRKLPSFFTVLEIENILHNTSISNDEILNVRNKLIVELFYSTGVRISELINIKLINIEFNTMQIKIMGKGSKERIVFFGDVCKNILDDYVNKCRDKLLANNKSEYLLLDYNGKKLTSLQVNNILKEIFNKAGIKNKASAHTLRHTFATHLLNNGADIKSVQDLLGHTSLSTTGIYTHVTNERLRSVYLNSFPRRKK